MGSATNLQWFCESLCIFSLNSLIELSIFALESLLMQTHVLLSVIISSSWVCAICYCELPRMAHVEDYFDDANAMEDSNESEGDEEDQEYPMSSRPVGHMTFKTF
jgi:hypothetical protein